MAKKLKKQSQRNNNKEPLILHLEYRKYFIESPLYKVLQNYTQGNNLIYMGQHGRNYYLFHHLPTGSTISLINMALDDHIYIYGKNRQKAGKFLEECIESIRLSGSKYLKKD